MKITLKQLAVFDAAARLGSVSAAAGEVHVTQSAASLALQDLERALGVQLFHRHRRNLTLNENGRRLQPKARSTLMLIAEIEGESGGGLSGVLRVAASPTIGNYLMPRICADFLDAHPGVQVKLVIANEPEIIEQVENLVFDLGFVEGVSMRHMLMVEPLVGDSLAIVANPAHWAVGKRLNMAQLERESWYLQSIGASARHAFTGPYSWLLGSGSITFETNSIEAIKGAVVAGEGIGCLSRLAVAEELRRGQLAELTVRGFNIQRSFYMISHKGVYEGGVHTAFVEQARKLRPAPQPGAQKRDR